jgi:VIT1/CCC1 family predicted Fe2+/Mn2+ transporter
MKTPNEKPLAGESACSTWSKPVGQALSPAKSAKKDCVLNRALPPNTYGSLAFQVKRREKHKTMRSGWLRAAVLGANDGILSTASLVLGVSAAHANKSSAILAAVAGLVAGAMSMAAGEYVSVHSQSDIEKADLEVERKELKADDKGERQELANIYIARGLTPALAKQVADQLMAHDALGAHARDELGISKTLRARPIQAALASAAAFAVGAAMPLLVTALTPQGALVYLVSGTSLLFLALLGGLAARVGGASILTGAIRVTFWGALAMAITAGVGALFGTVV